MGDAQSGKDAVVPLLFPPEIAPPEANPSLFKRLGYLIVGRPRDPSDPNVFHHISLIAFLAWVGLGADGLSSSAYGPEEAFRALHGHEYMALALAFGMAVTVGVIAYSYSLLIEHFPTGGGGYVVASKLLGPKAGVVSGSALVVDYVLTIAISIASGVDAILSFMPRGWHELKIPIAIMVLIMLTVINLRGVKESVKLLLPIFIVFLVTHVLLIGYGVGSHLGELSSVVGNAGRQASHDVAKLGFLPLLFIFLRAYSLGGGTYTGIEAVSNGLQILREPRVPTGRRTMLYMALSLAFTAGGILVAYSLWHVVPVEGKTLNAVLLENVFSGWTFGPYLVVITLLSEGFLLFVAAQAGFIDGPRVLANMAMDSWVPHNFASLSERLVTKNGILLMGAAAGILMVATKGNVSFLVVLYSINVFLTFSLTQLGMSRFWLTDGKGRKGSAKKLSIHLVGLVLCVSILVVTTVEKFGEGGWLTVVVTSGFIIMCLFINRHYAGIRTEIRKLDTILGDIGISDVPPTGEGIDDKSNVAALLVSGYGGLGVHTILSIQRTFPGFYKNLLFLSIGAVDSGHFKGSDEVEALRRATEDNLKNYVDLAKRLGLNAEYRYAIGTEVVAEAEKLCHEVRKEYPKATFFLGNLIFRREQVYHKLLHNDTAFSIQRRLQFGGLQAVVLPIRIA